jgi:glycosyltransferase involved in cell wall biosynthesis
MSADPHIVHVFSSAGLYGAEHVVLNLMPALSRLGISGALACIDNPYSREQPLYERASELGIPAERVPCAGRLDGATIRALRGLLTKHPRALLHVHGYKSAFYALRARQTCAEIPVIATLHGWVTNTHALRLYRLVELWMLRRATCICIVAESMRRPLQKAGIPGEKIRLIENGIDMQRFHSRKPASLHGELNIPRDAFVFGGVLRFSAEKNPLGLLGAFRHIHAAAPQTWLVLAGDGPQRGEFERRAREAGIGDRVRLLGARNDPERIYPLFDCFVLPSLSEGLPLALLEAMACERPIVASRVGQVETVLEGLPARLVPGGDTASLAEAMFRALDSRPPIAAMRQRVEARYSVDRMACDYAQVYREAGIRHVEHAA